MKKNIIFLAITSTIVFGIFANTSVFSFSKESISQDLFNSSNNVPPGYDPFSEEYVLKSNCDEASDFSGSDNAEKVFNYLTSTKFKKLGNKPMNAVQASAVLGNFHVESMGVHPEQHQIGGPAYGLAQWEGPRRHSANGLEAFAKNKGKDKGDLLTQLEFVKYELDNGEGVVLSKPQFLTGDIAAATIAWREFYERPSEHADSERIKNASNYLKKYGQSSGVSTTTVASDDYCKGGPGSGFFVYKQCDPKWATVSYSNDTICAQGCGPTSMSTITRALTGNKVPPTEMIKYAPSIPGKGSDISNYGSKIAEKWGYKMETLYFPSKEISIGTMSGKAGAEKFVNKILDKGGLVVFSSDGSRTPPHIGTGHYMVIRKRTSDSKWLVADPYMPVPYVASGTKTKPDNTPYDPNHIILYMYAALYGFYK